MGNYMEKRSKKIEDFEDRISQLEERLRAVKKIVGVKLTLGQEETSQIRNILYGWRDPL